MAEQYGISPAVEILEAVKHMNEEARKKLDKPHNITATEVLERLKERALEEVEVFYPSPGFRYFFRLATAVPFDNECALINAAWWLSEVEDAMAEHIKAHL